MLPVVDTSDSPTAVLNESQIGWLWERIDLGTGALCVLAVAMVWLAAGGPTIGVAIAWYKSVHFERVIRWYRWRIVGSEPQVPVGQVFEQRVFDQLALDRKAMTTELLDTINKRADHTDQRVSTLSQDVIAVASGQEVLRAQILKAHDIAEQAKETQANVVNSLARAPTNPRPM